MGTSSSYGGAGGKSPLLPAWALPGGVMPPAGDDGEAEKKDGDSNGENGSAESQKVSSAVPAIQISPSAFTAAKKSLGRAVSVGGRAEAYGRAGKTYVRAHGGAKGAAASARGAQASTARLGSFLSGLRAGGVREALSALGLAQYLGQDIHVVCAALVNAIASIGSDREQAAAREAAVQVVRELYEEYIGVRGDLAALEQMTPEAMRKTINSFVALSIFHRWLGDLSIQVESKAISIAEATRLERDMERYVRGRVTLDLQSRDALTIDWNSAEGRSFREKIYHEAYDMLGGGQ